MAEAVGDSEFGSINQELRSNLDTPRRQVYQLDDIIIEMSVLYPTSSDRASWHSLRGGSETLCLIYGKSDHSSRTDKDATPQKFRLLSSLTLIHQMSMPLRQTNMIRICLSDPMPNA